MLLIMNEIDPCLLLPLYVLYEIQNQIFQYHVKASIYVTEKLFHVDVLLDNLFYSSI